MNALFNCSILLLPLLVVCPAPCHADVPPGDTDPPPADESTRFSSEQDIWDYFEGLCAIQPTSRCYRDRVQRVREGEVLPAVPYEDEDFFPPAEGNLQDWIKCKQAIRQADGEPSLLIEIDGCGLANPYRKPAPKAFVKTKAK